MADGVNLNRRPGESEISYIFRIGGYKASGLIDMSWAELAQIFNKNLRSDGIQYNESAYRKKYNLMSQFKEELDKSMDTATSDELKQLKIELEKEKIKYRDERNEYNRMIREEARKESYREQFIRSIEEAAGKHPLEYNTDDHKPIIRGSATLVVPLSDIHCGIQIHNYWNDYDVDILRQMLNEYIEHINEIAVRHGCEDVVVCATELVSGIIHENLRLQNNQDLIDQFMVAMDYVCDFLAVLSTKFNNVLFYLAPGNHGRIVSKKDSSLSHENIENLVVPFVRSRLQNYPNIVCYDNEIDQGIVTVTIHGQKMVFVHGDLDTMDNAVRNMTKLTGCVPDIILLAHRHFNACKTEGNTKIIQSGSFVGTDEYAASRRLIGRAEQSPFVVTNNGVECVYDIRF